MSRISRITNIAISKYYMHCILFYGPTLTKLVIKACWIRSKSDPQGMLQVGCDDADTNHCAGLTKEEAKLDDNVTQNHSPGSQP